MAGARWEWWLVAGSGLVAAAAFAADRREASAAAAQAWPAFALVAGLLAIGVLAHEDGLFSWLGYGLGRLPLADGAVLVGSMVLVALVTAVLNLDTSVVFLTPTLVHVARFRGSDEAPFLYGTVLVSNAGSLLLPGSNLTNLIVLAHSAGRGSGFASRMVVPWSVSVCVTIAVVALWRREGGEPREPAAPPARPRMREGVLATVGATLLVLLLPSPALPVFVLGGIALAFRLLRTGASRLAARLDPTVVAALFGIVVGAGTLARMWDGPARLVRSASPAKTAAVAALAAALVNNLPAAMLLAARSVPHPRALLVGLDVGPNLAVTGSLSAVLWFRAARGVGASVSAARYSRIGIVAAPLAGVAAVWALRLTGASHL